MQSFRVEGQHRVEPYPESYWAQLLEPFRRPRLDGVADGGG